MLLLPTSGSNASIDLDRPSLPVRPATLKNKLLTGICRAMDTPIYKRILLKISGEALAAGQGFGVDNRRVHEIAAEIG